MSEAPAAKKARVAATCRVVLVKSAGDVAAMAPAAEGEVVLAYWAIRGLAQPVRYLLEYAGAAYADVRYVQQPAPSFDKSCWFDVKDTVLGDYPFPNLPYLKDDTAVVTQSNAILRYLQRKFDLLEGASAEVLARDDFVLEEGMDFRNRTVGLAYGKAGKWADSAPAYSDQLQKWLGKYAQYLGDRDWFAGGPTPTACDFVMYELLDQNDRMFPGALEKHPTLAAYRERFEETLDAVKAYRASANFILAPCNNMRSQTTLKNIC